MSKRFSDRVSAWMATNDQRIDVHDHAVMPMGIGSAVGHIDGPYPSFGARDRPKSYTAEKMLNVTSHEQGTNAEAMQAVQDCHQGEPKRNAERKATHVENEAQRQAHRHTRLPSPMAPAWMAINAGIAGVSYNDLQFYVEADGTSAYANTAMLDLACPQLLKRISAISKLFLSVDEVLQCDERRRDPGEASLSSPYGINTEDEDRLDDLPIHLPSIGNAAGSEQDKTLIRLLKRASKRIQPTTPVTADTLTRTATLKGTERSMKMRLIIVFGCPAPVLRALLFYLFTSEVRLVDQLQPQSQPSSQRPSAVAPPTCMPNMPAVPAEVDKAKKEVNDTALPSRISEWRRALPTTSSPTWMNAPPPFPAQAAYCLAVDLQLHNLLEAAQAYILSHLQPHTALHHYLSPFSQRYPPIRRGIMAYIEANWHDIRRRAETQQTLVRLARGDFPKGDMAMFKLLGRLDVTRGSQTPSSG